MAQMLIRTQDKEQSGDIYTDVLRTGRGDVIVIVGDDHQFSEAELTAPYWMIVKVPGVPVEKLEGYLASDPPLLGKNEKGDDIINRVARRRAFKFDIDTHLGAAKKPDDQRQIEKSIPDEATAFALRLTKQKAIDPAASLDGIVLG